MRYLHNITDKKGNCASTNTWCIQISTGSQALGKLVEALLSSCMGSTPCLLEQAPAAAAAAATVKTSSQK